MRTPDRPAPPQRRPVRLTGRGAVLGMLATFTLGLLGASGLGWPALAGGSFMLGSVAAAWYTAPGAMLTAAATPPLLFCLTVAAAKAATASGNPVLSMAEQVAIALAGAAPWLLAGTLLNLLIAWPRGLRQCLGEVRGDLRPGHRRPAGGSPRADR